MLFSKNIKGTQEDIMSALRRMKERICSLLILEESYRMTLRIPKCSMIFLWSLLSVISGLTISVSMKG